MLGWLRIIVTESCELTRMCSCLYLLHDVQRFCMARALQPNFNLSPLQGKIQRCQFEVNRLHKIYWGLETSEGVTIGIEFARLSVKGVFVTFTVVFQLNKENPAVSDRLFNDPMPLLCSSIVR